MGNASEYKGNCFCNAIQFIVRGEPAAMGYCHCNDCRHWSAGPINAFTLWKSNSLKVTQGENKIATYNKTKKSSRKFCTSCGGHLFTDHPQWDLVDIYAATIPSFPFKPGVHVHYKESVLRIKDGLPKLKNLPKEMGGSGEAVSE